MLPIAFQPVTRAHDSQCIASFSCFHVRKAAVSVVHGFRGGWPRRSLKACLNLTIQKPNPRGNLGDLTNVNTAALQKPKGEVIHWRRTPEQGERGSVWFSSDHTVPEEPEQVFRNPASPAWQCCLAQAAWKKFPRSSSGQGSSKTHGSCVHGDGMSSTPVDLYLCTEPTLTCLLQVPRT